MPKHLNPSALPKLEERLNRAKTALVRCGAARNYDEFCPPWTDLLMAGGSIFSILEQAARRSPQGRQWYGAGAKKDRKNDPLVQYMVQARNAEEHGIEPVTANDPGYTSFSIEHGSGKYLLPDMHFGSEGIKVLTPPIDLKTGAAVPLVLHHKPGHPKLIPVVDSRFGTRFDPPTEHLGTTLESSLPVPVADLYVTYLEGLISEASALMRD